MLLIPFGYRVYDFGKNFIITKNYKEIVDYKNSKKTIEKKYFWNDINNFEFKNDLKFKRVLLDLPNLNSKLFESTWESEIKNDGKNRFLYEILKFSYNKSYQGSLAWQTFWNNNITINEGHSQYLDISTLLANLENLKIEKIPNKKYNTLDKIYFSGGKILIRQTIPKISIDNDLIDFYFIDFILSDRELKNYKLFKKYEYDEFNLYIYELNSLKAKNQNIKKIIKIKNFQNYNQDIKNFNNILFVDENQKKEFTNINKFCDLSILNNKKNKIIFEVKNNNMEECIAIFPITFSYNNKFKYDKNKNFKVCDTFRAQYFFHGCLIKGNSKVELVKNNLLIYPLGSLKDYLDFRKLNIN